ncbi:hypothetical protein HELRODRAFT_174200 [Helobdella robusta]|uniref:Ig-like domain-containing protein n=1 Tax=Helobdella robusta TaxID=6412 RepID=T1F7R9_HELRO|nr:hypothetical protein HELRODRAFT_174200 [Helobdella robusta]ESO02782.1 hypothetical protein HELRODRAFT_174200 [Helobdella robusta]
MTKRLEYFQCLKRLLVFVVSVLTASYVAADKNMLNMAHNTDNYDTNVVSIDGPPRLLEKFPRTIKNVAGGSVTMVCPLQQPHQRQKKQQQKRPTDSTYSNSSTSSWSFSPSANDLMIEWRKNDRLIGIGWSRFQVKHDTLVISKVDMSDMGNYTCVATNGFGSVVSYYLLCIAESSADFDDVVDNPKYNKYCVEDDLNTNNYNDKHSVKKNKGWLTLDGTLI